MNATLELYGTTMATIRASLARVAIATIVVGMAPSLVFGQADGSSGPSDELFIRRSSRTRPAAASPVATGRAMESETESAPVRDAVLPPPAAESDSPAVAPHRPPDATQQESGLFMQLFRGSVTAPASSSSPRPPSPQITPGPQTAVPPPSTAVRARDMLEEAIALAREGRHGEAVPVMEEILRIEPTSMAAWEQLGWSYWALDRRADSVALWNRLIALDPGNPLPYRLLARVATTEGDLTKAIEYNRKSIELGPTQPGAQYDLARTLLWKGESDEAVPMLEEILEKDPNRIDVMIELAKAHTYAWRFDKALPLWEKVREFAPDDTSFMAMEATCRLHTNDEETARVLAGQVLDASPADPMALDVLASLEEFGDTPEAALPHLRHLKETAPDEESKERWRVRIIRLLVRLHRDQPRVYGLRESIDLARERIDFNPNSVDANLLLGELLLMDMMLPNAEQQFIKVLKDFNPYNIRARRGLMETYLVAKQIDRAREQLAALSRFNPQDPYLLYHLARLESSRGDFFKAHQALDRLEAAGQRGAVAILLYHGLTTSKSFPDALSVDRFREHMLALQNARARIVRCSELPAVLGETGKTTRERTAAPVLSGAGLSRSAGAIPLTVAVSFDDARRDSMYYGTQVAKELGMTFSMHVPIGYIRNNHSFIATFESLREYAKDGAWEYGGHMLDGAILSPVSPDGRLWHALPNRLWLPDLQRMETEAEYDKRLALEFSESRRILAEELGGSANFVAYPFGDIGQEDETNIDNPTSRILAQARRHCEVGFIQSVFGYAIAGDDPLLYQRHEMDRWMSGEDVVDYLYEHHPIYLARRLRAEYSALEGKLYRAREALEALENDGYPERPLARVKKYVNDRLSQPFALPGGPGTIKKSPWTIEIRKPYIGAYGEYFEDNQDRRNWRIFGNAGVNITPNLILEGRVGIGNLRQDAVDLITNIVQRGRTTDTELSTQTRRIDIDERSVGAKAVFTFPNGIYLSGDLLQRNFSGDVDMDMTAYALESQVRPFQPLDLLLRYEHDMAPSALAIAEDISYKMYMGVANVRIRDPWTALVSGMRYDFSDDNVRDHFALATHWTLHDRTGFRLGLRYSYDTSDFDSRAYWTPYDLRRYFVEGGFLGSYLRTYYNLRLRVGVGKEGIRRETKERYADTVERALRLGFDPGDPPDEDWEPVFGIAASARKPIGEHWVLHGEFSYNKNPNYNELTLMGGLRYKF